LGEIQQGWAPVKPGIEVQSLFYGIDGIRAEIARRRILPHLACIIHEDAEDEALGGAGLAKMRMVAGFCHAGVRDSSGGHLAP